MASNLRRSKRTVGKRISDINRRVTRLQKKSVPTSIAPGAVTNFALSTPVSDSIDTAQLTADGKNAIYYQASAPSAATTTLTVGDLWFDSDNGYALSKWNGTIWESFGLGNAAFSTIDAGKITTGVLSAITISGVTFNAGTLSGGVYPFSVSSAGVMRAVSGTIGAFTLSSSTLTASYSDVGVGYSISSSLSLGTNAQVTTRYDYSGLSSTYYTEIYLNKADEQGGIIVTGTASGSLQTTRVNSSFVQSRTILRDFEGAYSDTRLKSGISPLEVDRAIDIVKKMNPVRYVMNNQPDVERHGLIAQELHEIYPEVVFVGTEDVNDLPWAVDYSKLTVPLISTVQEMLKTIETLSSRVTELEGKE